MLASIFFLNCLADILFHYMGFEGLRNAILCSIAVGIDFCRTACFATQSLL